MIFSELYGTYYITMAKIIEKSIDHPIKMDEIRSIVEKYAFGESILKIESSIEEERWQVIKKDGSTVLVNVPSMPLTILQKRWLKAISLDPRMKLFEDEIPGLEDVEPLFTREDFYIFDKYGDGDLYEDEMYIKNFRLILDALRNKYSLRIITANRRGRELYRVVMPERLEYSEKDDKFRLIGTGCKYGETINLGRIITCEPYTEEFVVSKRRSSNRRLRVVEFELIDERNALERVLLHFAHFKKQAQRLDGDKYKISINYAKDAETEILIRILSFGPMIRVIGPNDFVKLIKDRLKKQKSCGH